MGRRDSLQDAMSPFEGLVRFAFAGDRTGIGCLAGLVKGLVGARRDAEDEAQDALFTLVRSSDRALEIVCRLAERNARLREAMDAMDAMAPRTSGRVPELSPAVLDSANAQLERYTARLIRNGRISRWRQRRGMIEVEHDDARAPIQVPSDDGAVLRAREIVLDSIAKDELRPPWLDESIAQIEGLAIGSVSMDDLTERCVRGDPELAAMPDATARVRGRNRVQKQHERARTHLLLVSDQLVAAGILDDDDGRMAKEWVTFLMRRRQKPLANASGGKA